MTGEEHTTESDELGERLLRVISAYGMGAALDARELHLKGERDARPSVVPAHGVRTQDVRQAAGHRRTVGA